MPEKERTCDRLFLLVGSNPLPNYLAALILKPRTICLLYSPETEEVKKRLRERLEARLADGGPRLEETCIVEVTSASKVRNAFLSKDLSDAHLHYTGGTKIMAAHARMAFRDAGGKDEQASYLDERKGLLRFDDGYEIDLSAQQLKLTLDDVLALHGIMRIEQGIQQPDGRPTGKDAEIIAKAVLNDPSLAGKLYSIHRDDNNKRLSCGKAKAHAVILDKMVPCGLSIKQIPEDHWNKKTYETWLDFLGGGWLETWCGVLVRHIANGDEIAIGLDCQLANGRQFEIDVALVRGHRLYVISCTTDTTIRLCKSKLFEVAMRARQLGGDLARSALVCLLHDNDSKGAFVDQLRNDVADVWDAPNTPQVFGLDDLKEWVGVGADPNTGTLRNWLDS